MIHILAKYCETPPLSTFQLSFPQSKSRCKILPLKPPKYGALQGIFHNTRQGGRGRGHVHRRQHPKIPLNQQKRRQQRPMYCGPAIAPAPLIFSSQNDVG